MSTQDRAIRGGEAVEHDAADAEGAVASGGLDPARMRAMQRRWIQRKAGGAGGGGGQVAIPDGSGAPLGGGVQARMERTLGADLSGVRVHTGGESAQAAESLGARAFTVGSDVHFGRGEFAPGSKEGDRLLAHELAHVVQGHKSGVQRKPAAHDSDAGDGDHEAGGHEVSEPGDAAEHEADAAGDHAAEALHGGGEHGSDAGGHAHDSDGDKGGGDEAGGDKRGGKKVEAGKPKLSAAAPSVGRKIFRAKKPAAAAAAPAAAASSKSAKQAPGGSKDAKAGGDAKTLPPAVVARIQSINKMLDNDASNPAAGVAVKSSAADVDQFAKDYADDASVKELRAKLTAKQAEIENKFQTAMKAATAAIAKIDATNPAHWGQLDALKKDPAILNWIGHPLFPSTHELTQAFLKAREAKSAEFADNKKAALDKAKQEIKAAPDKTESRAAIQLVLDGAKPYIQDRSPYHGALVVQMQEAFAAKLESIAGVEKAEKEKQEKLAKEQQQKAAHPEGGAGGKPGEAKAAEGKSAGATSTAPAAASASASASATAAVPAVKHEGEKKHDGAPLAKEPPKPPTSGAAAPATAGSGDHAAKPAAAPAHAEPPKPAGADPAHAATPASGDASAAAKPAAAPAAEHKAADKAADGKADSATAADATKAGEPTKAGDPTKASDPTKGGDAAAQPAPAAAPHDDPQTKELELKKEVAKARVHEYAAKVKGRTTILSGAMEIGNALMTVAKAFGSALHGIELPEELLSVGKDGAQSFLKIEGFSVEVQAAIAEAEIDSAESISEIDGLFESAEFLYTQHLMILSRAEAMFKAAQRCFEARVAQQHGEKAPEKKQEKAPEKKPEKAPEKKPDVDGAEAKGEDKKDEEHGLGDVFSGVMEKSDDKENADLGGYKQVVNNAAVVMDPLKAIKAGLEIRVELKSMAQAKRDMRAAEEALAKHLAEHGGSPLPDQHKKK